MFSIFRVLGAGFVASMAALVFFGSNTSHDQELYSELDTNPILKSHYETYVKNSDPFCNVDSDNKKNCSFDFDSSDTSQPYYGHLNNDYYGSIKFTDAQFKDKNFTSVVGSNYVLAKGGIKEADLKAVTKNFCASKSAGNVLVIEFDHRKTTELKHRNNGYFYNINFENPNSEYSCFNRVVFRGSKKRDAKILISSPNAGLVNVSGIEGELLNRDFYATNLEIDYLKTPVIQGVVTVAKKITDTKYDVTIKLDKTDDAFNVGDDTSNAWQQKRTYLTENDIFQNGSAVCKGSSYGTLYTEAINGGESYYLKKKHTLPAFSFSDIKKVNDNEILVKNALFPNGKKVRKDINTEFFPEVGTDKVVIHCNADQKNVFRIQNMNDYGMNNVTINTSGKVATYASGNKGVGIFDRYYIKRLSVSSNRITTAKSGFLMVGNRGKIYIVNSLIDGVFDDGVNLASSDMKIAKIITAKTTDEIVWACAVTSHPPRADDKVNDKVQMVNVMNGFVNNYMTVESVRNIKSTDVNDVCYSVYNSANELNFSQDDVYKVSLSYMTSTSSDYFKVDGQVQKLGNNLAGYNNYSGHNQKFSGLNAGFVASQESGNYLPVFSDTPSYLVKTLVGFNFNQSSRDSVIANNIISQNRHSAIAAKAPGTHIFGNKIINADFHPIHVYGEYANINIEGMIPRNITIESNYVHSRTEVSDFITAEVRGMRTNSSLATQKYPSLISIKNNLCQKSDAPMVGTISCVHHEGLKNVSVRNNAFVNFSNEPQ